MIFCFDLDGTLCETVGEDYAHARPIQAAIGHVNRLFVLGHTIVIDTARGSGTGIDWYQTTALQLERWGVRYHKLRCGVKIAADVYIDDRSLVPSKFFPAEADGRVH